MDKTSKFIQKFDMVGFQLKPTFNGSNRMKTTLGGFLSIIVITLMIFGSAYFGRELVSRSSPTISSSRMKVNDVKVPYSEFPLFLAVYNAWGQEISNDPEFRRNVKMTIEFIRFDVIGDDHELAPSYYIAPLVKCTKDLVASKYVEQALEDGYNPLNGICMDYKNVTDHKGNPYNGEVYIRNEYLTSSSGLITLKAYTCDEKEDPGCREYLNKNSRFWLNVFVADNFEAALDYHNPVKPNISSVTQTITQNIFARKLVNMEINEVITDNGIILENTVSEEYIAINSTEFSVAAFSESERMTYQLIFSMRQMKNTTGRKYLKLQELMANLGGFIKASIYVATAICHTYSEFVLYSEITLKINKKCKKEAKNGNYVLPKENSSNLAMNGQPLPTKKEPLEISFLSYVKSFFQSKTSTKGKINRELTFRFLDLNYTIEQMTKLEQLELES